MEPFVEQRLVQLLRDSQSPAVPLRDLHEMLVTECDLGPVSYSRLAESVKQRREVFILLESSSPLGDEAAWPAGVRAEYERALADAGVDTGPRVSLVDPGGTETEPAYGSALRRHNGAPWAELRESLLRIWNSVPDNAPLRTAVAAAIAGCADLPAALGDVPDASPVTAP